MWANLVKLLVIDVLVPIIKDLIFMAINFFKVRQLRKDQEEKAKKAMEDYAKNPTDDTFSKLP